MWMSACIIRETQKINLLSSQLSSPMTPNIHNIMWYVSFKSWALNIIYEGGSETLDQSFHPFYSMNPILWLVFWDTLYPMLRLSCMAAAVIEMSMNYLSRSLARLISPFISGGLNSNNNIFTEDLSTGHLTTLLSQIQLTTIQEWQSYLNSFFSETNILKCSFKQGKYTLNTQSEYKNAVCKGAYGILRLSEISKL